MSPFIIFIVIAAYFGVLWLISTRTGKNGDNKTYFTGNHNSPWYLVAFGMIGASLSGVTFISVPGWVATRQFSYMQMVLGYLVGYTFIALVLMPLYFRMRLTSIYSYLETRFGTVSYKTGAAFFLLSRTIGASFRLYLVAIVFQFILEKLTVSIPFAVVVAMSITLIYLYTYRGGIQTVVWTDTLQTFFMLASAGLTVWWIADDLNLGFTGMIDTVSASSYSQIFFWESGPKNFFMQFLSGAFIAFVMTGLDQDMMQKNLTCRNLREAQVNMFSFSVVLVVVNLAFLALGALLYLYGHKEGLIDETMIGEQFQLLIQDKASGEMVARGTDYLFPVLAIDYLPDAVGILFLLGLVAAAYSSADSALAALTTSYCVDFLRLEKPSEVDGLLSEEENQKKRKYVQLGFSVLIFVLILVFKAVNDDAVIAQIFKAAGFTYGPLLGLYAFGLLTRRKVKDAWVGLVCMGAVLLSCIINWNAEAWFGSKIGFEILIYNGGLTYLGLWIISRKSSSIPENA